MGKRKRSKQAGPPKRAQVIWDQRPVAHDFPAAGAFLGLLAPSPLVGELVAALQQAPTLHRQAKDILRAARLPLLGPDDPEVAKDLAKIGRGVAVSPVLLVRGDLRAGRAVQIADGYHRVCASYQLAEDTEIPCLLVDLPAVDG